MPGEPGRPHDVLDMLVQEHREVEELLNRLRHSDDETISRDVAERLIAHMVRHSVVEERFVYPEVRDYLIQGEEIVAHDLAEHEQLEVMLRELERLDPADARFRDVVVDVQVSLAPHFADEEAQQYALLRFAAPADELVRIRQEIERLEPFAATVARDDAPPGEVLRGWVGTGLGMVDRVRGALGGRRTA